MREINNTRSMRRCSACLSAFIIFLILNSTIAGQTSSQEAKNALTTINLTQKGIPADERAINSLLSKGPAIYGATSGRRAHIFKLDAGTDNLVDLAQIEGPAAIHHSLTIDANGSLWFGTMLDKVQTYMAARKKGIKLHLTEVSSLPITPDLHVGRLYRVLRPESARPIVEDMGRGADNQNHV